MAVVKKSLSSSSSSLRRGGGGQYEKWVAVDGNGTDSEGPLPTHLFFMEEEDDDDDDEDPQGRSKQHPEEGTR
jgi:hypothetical protein